MSNFPWSGQRTFRTVDEWKSAFMTLPDNIFYELVRSILGNIKTPFSKPRLLDDLVNFLSKDEIRKIIAAYIDEQDHKIISAVAFFDEPTTGDLEAFFAGEFTPAELHALVINLEERLILYRLRLERNSSERSNLERGEGPLRLALNPILSEVLAPFVGDIRPLFSSYNDETPVKAEESELRPNANEGLIPDDRTMAALLAFVQGEEELFKDEAVALSSVERNSIELRSTELRKKVLDEWKRIFPRLDLEMAIRVLLRLGLLRQKGRSLVPCDEKMSGFCELPAVERQEYWAAGVCLCLDESRGGAHNGDDHTGFRFSWSRLRRIASFIHIFRGYIDPERVYPETTLRRFWELLEREKRLTGSPGASPFFYDSLQLPFKELLEVMEKTGFLVKTGAYGKNEYCWKATRPVPHRQGSGNLSPDASSKPGVMPMEKPVIVMDTAFSFFLYPEISFTDAVSLGTFCTAKENTDAAVHFEITRQSVVRGFDRGIKADAMIALLERLSLNRLDDNLGWTLREWESRYSGVSLYQGIVLVLEEDRRYLAEAGPISHLVRKTLAPGVYLLSSAEKAEAVKALLKAGVDIVAQPPLNQETGWNSFSRNAFSRLGSSVSAPAFRFADFKEDNEAVGKTGDVDSSDDAADSIKQNFRLALEKMRFTKAEKDELIARIERRLILSEAQLDGASVRYEKLEARGLDYAGKSTIAKQAVEAGFLVEVTWPGPDGESKRTAGIAQALEKKEGDSIFVFRSGGAENDAKIFRVPLGKISLLRRIKQSIFEE